MKQHTILALQYGSVTGLAMGLWLFAEHALGFHHQYQHLLGVSSLLSALLPVFGISALFSVAFKRQKLTWKRGLAVGSVGSLALGVVAGALHGLYVATLNSELLTTVRAELVTALEADSRFSPADIAEFTPLIDALHTPVGFGVQAAIVGIVTGLFLSVLTIGLVRALQFRARKK